MIAFNIIFAFVFTLLMVLALKYSTNEYGEPFHIKVIYIFLSFLVFLIPLLNVMLAIVLIFIFSLGLVFEEIKLKPKSKIMNKIINFLSKEI
jgi:hypothetical protein